MFSKVTKQMLKNVIRHTGTHNRMVEEQEMWSQRHSTKERDDKSSQKSFLYDQRSDYYDDRRRRRERTAHMDSDSDGDQPKSTYWARQLQKAEEADPDRWGHSGFKELYPDDFNSGQSDNGGRDMSKKKKRRKKEKKQKKKKKKRKYSESESDSDSDKSARMDRKASKHKRSKHKSRKRYESSDSESSVDSYHKRRKRRKSSDTTSSEENRTSRKKKKHR